MIKGIDHAAISTGDFGRLVEFYCGLLTMELVADATFKGALYDNITDLKGAGGRVGVLQLGSMKIEVFEFTSPTPRTNALNRPVCDHGITHLCFLVEDIEAEYARLKEAGVPFHCPPQDAGWAKATYARDPDGNVVEIIEIMKK